MSKRKLFDDPSKRVTKRAQSPPKISMAEAKVMDEDQLRSVFERYQTTADHVSYDKNCNMAIDHIKNTSPRRIQGHRFVTAKELVRLLMAEPWRDIAENAFQFRVIDPSNSNASVKAIKDEVCKTMKTFEYLLARWEQQFFIQLPSEKEAASAYPDRDELAWIMAYRKERTKRSTKLNQLKDRLNQTLKESFGEGELPSIVEKDPGLMMISDKLVPWIPTNKDLLYDMACRANRDPTRFYSVFNPATHAFYKENLHFAFRPAGQMGYIIPSLDTTRTHLTDDR